MKQYIVDAFTDKPFSGNPAAVCVMDRWPEEDFMMKLAMENNLSETAFIVKEKEGYHLRWFTPGSEVELCGSAHCQIADYWSKELGKSEIHAYQASKRGGHLYCKLLENGRIKISGEATLVAISDIVSEIK